MNQTTTPKQHLRAKREALGYEAIREQMNAIARDNEAEAQTREIKSYRAIRESLTPDQLEILMEFKHVASPGATTLDMATIAGLHPNTVKAIVTKLRTMKALEPTGYVDERPRPNRITREGINILQSRS